MQFLHHHLMKRSAHVLRRLQEFQHTGNSFVNICKPIFFYYFFFYRKRYDLGHFCARGLMTGWCLIWVYDEYWRTVWVRGLTAYSYILLLGLLRGYVA